MRDAIGLQHSERQQVMEYDGSHMHTTLKASLAMVTQNSYLVPVFEVKTLTGSMRDLLISPLTQPATCNAHGVASN